MTEYKRWVLAQYPYDFASCGLCILMHTRESNKCKHTEMALTSTEQLGENVCSQFREGSDQWLVKNRERITALRELFANCYPTNRTSEQERPCPNSTSALTVFSSVS